MTEAAHNIVEMTRELLQTRRHDVTFKSLEMATGVDKDFINRLSLGRLQHPSVHKIIALYEHLSGRKVEY